MHDSAVETAVEILVVAFGLASTIVVLWLFVWAAKKDGQDEREFRARIGEDRRTATGARSPQRPVSPGRNERS